MDTSNLGRGALVAGISGALLFIFMFFSWYGIGGEAGELVEQAQEAADALGVQGPEDVNTSANAWESFDFTDLILFLAAATGIAFAVIALANLSVELPIAFSAIVTGLGVLATLLVLYRIINPPGEGDVDREIGIYLGLLASAGLAIGGYLGMQEEGADFSAR